MGKKHATKFDDTHNLNVNKRRLGNFLLLKENINIRVSDKPPEVKVEEYFNDWTNDPNTVMIRELKVFFDDAKTEEEKRGSWKRKTAKYWYNVYQRFLDMREEKMINCALKRWRVSELHSKISEVSLDSLNSGNKIYTTKTDNSFSQKSGDLAGSLSGPEDLSTSAEHMAEYGR